MSDFALRTLIMALFAFLISISASAENAATPTPPAASAPQISFAPDGTVSSFIAEVGGQNIVAREENPDAGFISSP